LPSLNGVGFTIERHRFESVLEVRTFDEGPFASIIAAKEAEGIRFFSLADVGNTEANQRTLYDLNRLAGLDEPGSDGTFAPFEDFARHVFAAPWFRADGQILAADGDRWVGLAAVGHKPEIDAMFNAFTGVDPAYRGRQIALALKLLTIPVARRYGTTRIRTNNDSLNPAMLAINRKLGYVQQPGYYRLLREL